MSDTKTLVTTLANTDTSRRGFLKSALLLGGALALVAGGDAAMAQDDAGADTKGKKGKGKGKHKGNGKKGKHKHAG